MAVIAYGCAVPVFDDSVRGTHAEDFQLLRSGHLHFYRHRWARDRLLADLDALGYELITVDLASRGAPDAIHGAVISAVPDWPEGYGQSTWLGFGDGLTDHLLHTAREQVVLLLTNWDQAYGDPQAEASTLLDLLARVAPWHLLFGRRLICLIETDNPDFELPLGEEYVGWNPHEWLYPHRLGERIPPWIVSENGNR